MGFLIIYFGTIFLIFGGLIYTMIKHDKKIGRTL